MQIKLIFDGGLNDSNGSRGFGYGSYQITVPRGNCEDRYILRVLHRANMTNNESEYATLISALEYLHKIIRRLDLYKLEEVLITGDSELVRRQVGIRNAGGEWVGWKVNTERLRPYRDRCRLLLDSLPKFVYNHVSRKVVVKVLGH